MTEHTNKLTIIKSSRKRRIVAFLIDHIVFSFLAVSIIFLIMGPDFIDKNDFGRMKTVMILVMIPVFIVYFCKDFLNGISLGRWIMGIMVRDANSKAEVPSKAKLFIRNLLIIIWPIEFLVLAFNKDKKRLGDNYTKTIVLKNPDKAVKSYRIIALVFIFLVFFGFTTLFTGTALKSSEAYKIAIHNIENNTDILKETGGIKGYGSFPKGNINVTNGFGQAGLEIKVIGNTRDMEVSIFLEKKPNGIWTVTELR
jgi:uncharacterized RDD family membrane protein YckC